MGLSVRILPLVGADKLIGDHRFPPDPLLGREHVAGGPGARETGHCVGEPLPGSALRVDDGGDVAVKVAHLHRPVAVGRVPGVVDFGNLATAGVGCLDRADARGGVLAAKPIEWVAYPLAPRLI